MILGTPFSIISSVALTITVRLVFTGFGPCMPASKLFSFLPRRDIVQSNGSWPRLITSIVWQLALKMQLLTCSTVKLIFCEKISIFLKPAFQNIHRMLRQIPTSLPNRWLLRLLPSKAILHPPSCSVLMLCFPTVCYWSAEPNPPLKMPAESWVLALYFPAAIWSHNELLASDPECRSVWCLAQPFRQEPIVLLKFFMLSGERMACAVFTISSISSILTVFSGNHANGTR